jgi:hypothetical protein
LVAEGTSPQPPLPYAHVLSALFIVSITKENSLLTFPVERFRASSAAAPTPP